MYKIQFFSLESPTGSFATLTAARKALSAFKKEDKETCRKRFKAAKVTSTKDSYKIEFGCNLYSAASIVMPNGN